MSSFAGGVDEGTVACVDAHMGHPPRARHSEEHQVPWLQIVTGHGPSRVELGPRGPRKAQAVELVDGHGQAAAVEALVRRTSPQVGHAKIAARRLHQAPPQSREISPVHPNGGLFLRRNHPEPLDEARFPQRLRPLPGRLPRGEISEAHPVEPAGAWQISGIEALHLELRGQPRRILHLGEGPHLKRVADAH